MAHQVLTGKQTVWAECYYRKLLESRLFKFKFQHQTSHFHYRIYVNRHESGYTEKKLKCFFSKFEIFKQVINKHFLLKILLCYFNRSDPRIFAHMRKFRVWASLNKIHTYLPRYIYFNLFQFALFQGIVDFFIVPGTKYFI